MQKKRKKDDVIFKTVSKEMDQKILAFHRFRD